MQTSRTRDFTRVQRTLAGMQLAENLRRGDDRTNGLSELPDPRDPG